MPEVISTVEYLPVQDFPGYRVGDDGSVWSAWELIHLPWGKGRIPGGTRSQIGTTWRKLKHILVKDDKYKAPFVCLWRNRKINRRMIHLLVLEAFVGPRPDGMEGCHNNGDRTDCRLSNVRWDTHKSNQEDMVRHGNSQRGEIQWKAKLTTDDILEIRRRCESGELHRAIAAYFGVSRGHVTDIANRGVWAWLADQRTTQTTQECST